MVDVQTSQCGIVHVHTYTHSTLEIQRVYALGLHEAVTVYLQKLFSWDNFSLIH